MNSTASRRSFLKAAAVVAAPTIVPSSVFGANAPSNRINIGCIGLGRQAQGDTKELMGFSECRVVAVCDLDANRLAYAKQMVDAFYADPKRGSGGSGDCAAYRDFREIIDRPDIDAVSIVTPDHWHALPAIMAARAGKDILLQKPLTFTLEEGRILSDTVRRYGRVLQVHSQQRSAANFRFGCELVRNGRIGKLVTVKTGFNPDPAGKPMPVTAPPPQLDYDFWLGPAPYSPYIEERVHPQKGYGRPGWLRTSDYCLGMITGWGSHHNDIAQWGMDTEHTGPVEIEAKAIFPSEGVWDVHTTFQIEYTYANGVKLICADTSVNKSGIVFEGTEGWVHVNRGFIDAHPKSLLTSVIRPGEIHLYQSNSHKGNWLECVRTRRTPIAPVEIGHRSCSVCILGNIAMRLGRRLNWNPEAERFANDAEANRMLSRPYRAPWKI